MTPQPTAAARRCAEKIAHDYFYKSATRDIASIIDEQTGLAELAEALSCLRAAVKDVLLPAIKTTGPTALWLAEEAQWCDAIAKTDAALAKVGK